MPLWFLPRGRGVVLTGAMSFYMKAFRTPQPFSYGGNGDIIFAGTRIQYNQYADDTNNLGYYLKVTTCDGTIYTTKLNVYPAAAGSQLAGSFSITATLTDAVDYDDFYMTPKFGEYLKRGTIVTTVVTLGAIAPPPYTTQVPEFAQTGVNGIYTRTGLSLLDNVPNAVQSLQYSQITGTAQYDSDPSHKINIVSPGLNQTWLEGPPTNPYKRWVADGQTQNYVSYEALRSSIAAGQTVSQISGPQEYIACSMTSFLTGGWDVRGRVYDGKDGYPVPAGVHAILTNGAGTLDSIPITPNFTSSKVSTAEISNAGVNVPQQFVTPFLYPSFVRSSNINIANPYTTVQVGLNPTDLLPIGEGDIYSQTGWIHLWKWDAAHISKNADRVVDDGTTLTPTNGTWSPDVVGDASVSIVGGHVRMTWLNGNGLIWRKWNLGTYPFSSSPGLEDWHSCHRYLQIKVIPRSSNSPTITLRVMQRTGQFHDFYVWKKWTITTAPGDLNNTVTKIIDLCSPDSWGTYYYNNRTFHLEDVILPLPAIDGHQSVYPMFASLGTDGPYWGVSDVGQYEWNIGGNSVVDFVEARQVLNNPASPSTSTLLSIYDSGAVFTYIDGNRQVAPDIRAITDGKDSLEVYTHDSNEATWYSIRHAIDQINGLITGSTPKWPSWVADYVALDTTSDFTQLLSYNRPARCLGGHGVIYGWGADDIWKDRQVTDTNLGLTIPAQLLGRSMAWQPGMGDVIGFTDGKYGPITQVRATAILRSDAEGVCLNTDGSAASGTTVEVVRSSDKEAAGTGVTNAQGAYVTGLARGKGGSTYITRPQGTAPATDRQFQTDFRHRYCFRVAPQSVDCIETDSPRSWIHVGIGKQIRTYYTYDGSEAFRSDDYAVDKWLMLRTDPRRGTLIGLAQVGAAIQVLYSEDGGQTGTGVLNVPTVTSAIIERDSERGMLVLLWENGANVKRQYSQDGGATWSSAVDITKDGATFTGTLVDAAQDQRPGTMFLVCSGAVLASDDMGETWTTKLA